MVAEASLKNLEKRKTFPKGTSGNPKGRPRKKAWIEELDALASSSKQFRPFLLRILQKKPIEAMHLLAGKPREIVQIDQNLKAEVKTQEIVELASQARAELEKQLKGQKPPINAL